MSSLTVTDARVACQMENCGFKSHSLIGHLGAEHNLSVEAYLALHKGASTMSQPALEALQKRLKALKRKPAPMPDNLSVRMLGFEVQVDSGVSASDCLPMPSLYAFPQKGEAKKVCARVLRGLLRRRNIFYWGMPGTGKDAICHAFSALTRRPVVMVTFRPGTDLAPWFYTRSVNAAGTGWEFGHLWKALTEGILGRDGKRRAPLLALSDVDRADEAQAEWFRILADSISGRILDPHGKMVELFRDEDGHSVQFFSTANSCGTGDARGRMASANPIDASLFDRLGRKIEAVYMDWADEGAILKRKFPEVARRAPKVFDQLGAAVTAVRSAIKEESIYAELTHRGLCEIMMEAEDLLHFSPKTVPANLMQQAICAWTEGLEGDTRTAARRLIDPHIAGGAL